MILEIIHLVLGNLVHIYNKKETYIDKDDPLMSVLADTVFTMFYITNILKYYNPGKLVFGCDIILPIKHKTDWELTHQKNQTEMNKDN